MTKKIVALLLALVMVLAMTACAKTEAPKADAPAADAPAADAPAADAPAADAPAADGEVAQLMYYMYSSSDSAVREDVQDAINAYIEPLIGANVTFNMITGGDWSNKAVTGLQAGEEIDIFFTADWLSYMTCVTMELFTPLNDDAGEYGNLLEQYGQGILTSLNPAFITGTQVEGVNYAVPTNKELCVPMGFIYNTDVAAEVGMDPASIKSIADFEPYLAKYLELTGKPGYLADGSWGDEPWVAGNVSNLSANLIAMKYDPDEATGEFDTTWYSVWETPENKAHVELMYKWYNAGYIHPDSPLSDFGVTSCAEFAAGEWLFVSQPLKGANIKGQELVQASGNKDLHVDEIYGQGKVCITTHAGGSMLAIPRTSNHPVEAMKYINMLHSDKTLLDMELFGVPEKHWVLAEDGRVDVIDSQWYGSHGGAWTKGNTALQNVTTVEDPEKNKKLQEYSDGSLMHPSLGFRYVQQPELEAQWAAVNNVQTEYNRALLTGSVDPATQLPAYIDALKAAGLDDIKANVQAQYDAWLAASGK